MPARSRSAVLLALLAAPAVYAAANPADPPATPAQVVEFFATHDPLHSPRSAPAGSDIQVMLADIAARPDAYAPIIAAELDLPETIEDLDPTDPSVLDRFRRQFRLLDDGLLSRLGPDSAEPVLLKLFPRALDLQRQSQAALREAQANVPHDAEARRDPEVRRCAALVMGFEAFEQRLLKDAKALRTPVLIPLCIDRLTNAAKDAWIRPTLNYLLTFWQDRPEVQRRLKSIAADEKIPAAIREQVRHEINRIETALQKEPK